MESDKDELLEIAKLGLEFAKEQLSREKFEFADYPKFYESTEKYVEEMKRVIENYELRESRDALEKAYNDLKEDIDWILAPDPCCPNKTEYGMKIWNCIGELQNKLYEKQIQNRC